MAMTEEEILSEAARIRASRRRRVERTCGHCGTKYEGLVHSRYCSDRCRVAASRQRRQLQENEMTDDFTERVRKKTDEIMERATRWLEIDGVERLPNGELSQETLAARERARATVEDLVGFSERISRGRTFDDSTEILRREREERSCHLASL
jgi:hypothetical protein